MNRKLTIIYMGLVLLTTLLGFMAGWFMTIPYVERFLFEPTGSIPFLLSLMFIDTFRMDYNSTIEIAFAVSFLLISLLLFIPVLKLPKFKSMKAFITTQVLVLAGYILTNILFMAIGRMIVQKNS